MNNINFKNFCESKNFELIKIINFNKRKDSAILLVRSKNDQNFVIKIYGHNAPEEIKKSFEIEINFYKNFNFYGIPKLFDYGNNFFILEYFEGLSLTESVKKYFLTPNEFNFSNSILSTFDWFYGLGSGIHSAKNNQKKFIIDSFLDRLGNLLTSGLKDSKKSKLESFFLRRFYKNNFEFLGMGLTKIVDCWINDNLKILSFYGHNDLHSNNVLVDQTLSKIKLIDFENIKSPGIWICDIIYFYGTLFALFSTKKELQNEIKSSALNYICTKEPNFNKNQIEIIIDIFCKAAASNSRFRLYDKGIKITKMLQYRNSIRSLI